MANTKTTQDHASTNPIASESGELSDEQLEQIAGGFTPVPIPEKISQASSLLRAPQVSTLVSAISAASIVKAGVDGGGGVG
jgi:hypothetical protein